MILSSHGLLPEIPDGVVSVVDYRVNERFPVNYWITNDWPEVESKKFVGAVEASIMRESLNARNTSTVRAFRIAVAIVIVSLFFIVPYLLRNKKA